MTTFISLGRFSYLLTRRDAHGRTETSDLTIMSEGSRLTRIWKYLDKRFDKDYSPQIRSRGRKDYASHDTRSLFGTLSDLIFYMGKFMADA